jgi:hypothetical protein
VQLQQVGHIKQQYYSIANHNLLVGWRETEEREMGRKIICPIEEKECDKENLKKLHVLHFVDGGMQSNTMLLEGTSRNV